MVQYPLSGLKRLCGTHKEREGTKEASVILATRDLAVAAGISEQAVRDYEASGLLPPAPRQANGYRAFSAIHLATLCVLRALKEAGYSRDEIAIVMAAIARGSLAPALRIIDHHHHLLAVRRMTLAQAGADRAMGREGESRPDSGRRQPLSIGEAAARLGVRTSTLRFWESLALFRVARNPANGYREFDEVDLDRIAAIMRMRALDISWDAIREAMRDDRRHSTEATTAAVDADLFRQSWLNARATAMVCTCAAAMTSATAGVDDDPMQPFLQSLAAMTSAS